jgi:ADP-heptose:LPS heptosyltransferase
LQHYGVADLLMAKPALQAIRNRFPGSAIVVITSHGSSSLFQHDDVVDVVFEFTPTLKSWLTLIPRIRAKYDLSIVLTSDNSSFVSDLIAHFSGAKYVLGAQDAVYEGCRRNLFYNLAVDRDEMKHEHQIDRNLAIPGVIGGEADRLYTVAVSGENREQAANYLRENGFRPDDFLLIVDFDAMLFEQLWNAQQYVALVNKFVYKYNARVLVRSGNRRELFRAFLGGLSFMPLDISDIGLELFGSLASLGDLVITASLDTMHFSAAVNTSVIGLFGLEQPSRVAPGSARCMSLSGYDDRIETILISDVLDAAEKLVQRYPKSDSFDLDQMDISDQALQNYIDTLKL